MDFDDLFSHCEEYIEFAQRVARILPRCDTTSDSISNFLSIVFRLKEIAGNDRILVNILKMMPMNRLSERMLTEMGEMSSYDDLIIEIAFYKERHNL